MRVEKIEFRHRVIKSRKQKSMDVKANSYIILAVKTALYTVMVFLFFLAIVAVIVNCNLGLLLSGLGLY